MRSLAVFAAAPVPSVAAPPSSPALPLPPPRPTLRPSSPLHSLLAQPPPLRSLPLRPMQWFFTPRAVPSSPRGPASIPRLGDQATLRRLPVHLVEPARGKGSRREIKMLDEKQGERFRYGLLLSRRWAALQRTAAAAAAAATTALQGKR